MKLNKISADMVSRRPDQTAEWLNRLARQVDIVEANLGSTSKKPGDLPIATTYSLGVIKVGQNLSITPEGVLSALAPTSYDYALLFNKPKINNVELIGNKSLADLGIDIPTKTSELLNDGSDGTSTYVETDELATVATSGSYNDLLNKPTIGNATLTIQKNGTSAGTFTANATSNKSINITVPTNTSDLVNDGSDGVSPFVDSSELSSDLALKQDKLIAGANIQIAQDGKTISATDTTYSAGNGLNLNGTTFSVDTSTIATQADITALDNAKQDNLTQAQLNAVNSGIDSTKVAQIATNTSNITSVTNRVTTIEGKIPSAATSSNKLTDKNYVDSAIATNSANYISDNGQPFQSLADLEAYSGPLTNNDYAFVVWTDSAGNTNYTRYKYVAATQTWAEEYTISNPTFSSTQWAAIDSGVTANDVAQITTNKNDIAGLQTSKQDKLTAAQQAAVDSGINTTKVTQITTNANNITNLQNNKQDKLSQAQLDAVNSGITAAKVTKLDGIEAGAEVNVQADWNEASSSSDAYIKNKPTIGNATLTIQKNGTNVQTFTANATSNKTANITVPTKTSDITNDGADGTSTYVENDDLTTALAGKQDTLTAGTNINLVSNTISTQTRGIEYIVGTQASATNLWTGVSTDNGCSSGTLYVGKTIVYYLNKAGNSTAATLNLTLPDGTTTGGIPIRRNASSTVTTHWGADTALFMVYDGTYWKISAYYDSNSTQQLRNQNQVKAAATITDNRLTCGTSAGYKMVAANETYDINYPLLWFNGGSNLASGATSNAFYRAVEGRNLRNNKANWTGSEYTMTYLVGTLSGNTFTIDPDVFTQTVPTTEDGKVYTPIGLTYNSTYQIYFFSFNVYYEYKNGAFRPISHSEPVMTGADAGTAGTAGLVPAPAAGDNTKYLSGDGTWKTVSQYNLPIASASELGGVKIGSRLTINSSTGVLSADSQTDNNFTTTLKNKLDGIASGAEVNVQANWTEANSSSDAYIKNKPSLATVATSGSYNDLTNKPTIPAAQVNSDWNANSGVAQILNKPSLATVATSGSYNDLTNKPTIPTVNNATLTIQKNGSTVKTFTANASSNVTANITVPTTTSDITNDSGYITSSGTVAKADQLTTARTIAIGTGATGTATSFDGTSNITIPITDVKDAYVTWGGKNLTQNVSPDDMGCIDEFGHNKLAYLPASCLDVAYSTDGGTTWVDYGASDANKVKAVTTAGPGFYVGGPTDNATSSNITNLKLRVRLAAGPTTGGKVYTAAKKILINMSTQGASGCKVAIRYRSIANYIAGTETWTTVGTYDVAGGSGWNSIPFNYTFGGSFTTQTSQMGQIEFVLYCTGLGTWGLKKPDLIDFRMIGGTNWTMPSEMARAGHLYTVDEGQNAAFPANVKVTGSLQHGSYSYTLPNKNGTVAMTSDLPTVNNATLTIQKNSTNVAAFTANASSNVTANISVPTKTSELTNDSGFITDTTTQDFAVQEGSTNPVFDDMTPTKTFTWTVADTTYRPVYQFDNTGWAYDNMDLTIAYRITVTGSGISQVTDIIDRWFSPTSWPVTSVMCRTLSTSSATTGYRYLRAVYPTSSGLNNNTYKFGQEIANYNATSRTIKVEVFKTATGVTWNETKPAGPIYTSSTYQATNAMQPYATRGWIFRAAASLNATSADAASRITSYESATTGSSAIKSGEALTGGYLGYQADDGKIYMLSNTAKNMACDENAKIGYISNNVNNNTAIDSRYLRPMCNLGSTSVGYIPHATIALGNRVYLRCTMDSSGNIHSDNYLATSMAPGYTWVPFGTATASNTIYMDARKPTFYTIDSSGRLVRVNGKPTGIEQAAFVGNTLSPAPSTFVYTDNIANGAVTMNKVAKSEFLDFFYPVGSYYETSDVAFNPNNTWGGTWVEDTAGRVLVAKDSGTFDTVGDVGGVEQETHRHWQSGGSDTGSFYDLTYTAAASEGLESRVISRNRVRTTSDNTSTDGMRQTTTYDATTSALQPYIVVKRWHRTA